MNIIQSNTYIFKNESTSILNVIKGEVLEVTKTTYLIKFETGSTIRYLKDSFKYTYNPIELIDSPLSNLLNYDKK